MLADEGAAGVIRAKQPRAVGEREPERGDVRPERIIGRNCAGDHVRTRRFDAGVDAAAVIAPRPAVERTVPDLGQVVGNEVAAEFVALVATA